jgi:hypothetical protein
MARKGGNELMDSGPRASIVQLEEMHLCIRASPTRAQNPYFRPQ